MKLILLSLSFVFILCEASAQDVSEEPFRGATTITIRTENTDSFNVKQFSERLLDYDYFIADYNELNNLIETELHNLKEHPNYSHRFLFRIRFKDGDIIVKPFWTANISIRMDYVTAESSLYQWEYARSRMDIQNNIYNDTMEMIDGYCDCVILYSE